MTERMRDRKRESVQNGQFGDWNETSARQVTENWKQSKTYKAQSPHHFGTAGIASLWQWQQMAAGGDERQMPGGVDPRSEHGRGHSDRHSRKATEAGDESSPKVDR